MMSRGNLEVRVRFQMGMGGSVPIGYAAGGRRWNVIIKGTNQYGVTELKPGRTWKSTKPAGHCSNDGEWQTVSLYHTMSAIYLHQ